MKVIHTSDWHLGQQLHSHSRQEEHRRALDWLADLVQVEEIDLVLVSGDVFDLTTPPNYARQMYYQFFERITRSGRTRVVITAGNHDSPATLHLADKFLLRHGIQIVGTGSEAVEKEILEIRTPSGQLQAVVAAVPFLRDSVILPAIPGESPRETIVRRRANIKAHYQQIGQALSQWQKAGVPLIATGHLYVRNSDDPEKQDNIYMGDRANMDTADFPALLDYVALGHIHKPQALDPDGKIRYSGSLIPLSFSERPDDKQVWLLEFEGRHLKNVEARKVPLSRHLKTIACPPEKLREQLTGFAERHREPLEPWVWVKLDCTQGTPPQPVQLVAQAAEDLPLRVVTITLLHADGEKADHMPTEDLRNLSPIEVFDYVLAQNDITLTDAEALKSTFRELLERYEQEDKTSP